ncbi:DUF5011 domain-containing protein [Acholeplasma sp. OttesenSCG-928-E16]|nr:DUF5011 domain-containing protein [Acholeplasma sp. OttesenSCG-928-E16]
MKYFRFIFLAFLIGVTLYACGPSIKLTGVTDKEVMMGMEFDPLDGVKAMDSKLGDITENIIVSGEVNINKLGSYDLEYSVVGSNNQKAEAKRKITVVDFVTEQDVLNLVSDFATAETKDQLVSSVFEKPVKWQSSNPNLYSIKDNVGTVNKSMQKHQSQTVTISATIENEDNTISFFQKDIVVGPIVFAEMRETPVSTYFSTGVMSFYKSNSTRYKNEGKVFSDNTREVLDIVNYAFVEFDANAEVKMDTAAYVSDVVDLRNDDVRAIFCIKGVSGTGSQNFSKVCSDGVLRTKFVKNLMDLVDEHNFDGLDIDWETADGYPVVASLLNLLVRDLKGEMIRRQEEGGSPYLLSAAIPSSGWGLVADRFDIPTLNLYLDYINLMSYDMNSSAKTTHVSPLHISSYDGGFGFGGDYGVTTLTKKGFDPSKIIVGASGYGKAYKVTGPSKHQDLPFLGVSGTLTSITGVSGSYASGTLFLKGVQELIATGRYEIYHEYNTSGNFVGTYIYSQADGYFVTYDSDKAISEKYRYVLKTKGQGIMFWCYGEDADDIIVDTLYKEYMRSQTS